MPILQEKREESKLLHLKFISFCYNSINMNKKREKYLCEEYYSWKMSQPSGKYWQNMKMQRYEVTEACDGDEAVALLKSQNFDLAVLDIIVPKRSGLEVLAYIRQEYPDMAVIMLTALDDEQTQVKAFNAYADDYVIKPVSPLILLKRMETILRRTTHNRTSSGIKDQTDRAEQGLSIDQDAYQAYYDGR